MRRLAPVVLALLLPACGGEALSTEEVLGEMDALEKPLPGLYRTQAELVSFEMPGLPPAEADRFRDQMTGLSDAPQERCVSAEEAERGFEDLLKTIGEGVNGLTCGFETFTTDPPRLDAVLACTGSGAMSAQIAFDGSAQADGIDMTMGVMASTPVIPGQTMEMEFNVSSQRIGECPADGGV